MAVGVTGRSIDRCGIEFTGEHLRELTVNQHPIVSTILIC